MHDALPDGADGGFGAVLDLEFTEQSFQVGLDGIFGDIPLGFSKVFPCRPCRSFERRSYNDPDARRF